jgi:drug/metabolite transporter (DMT)-like permease
MSVLTRFEPEDRNRVWSYRAAPASRVAAYLYAVPVVAVVIAWIWLDETPPLASLIGGAHLALLGVALARSPTVRRPVNLDT